MNILLYSTGLCTCTVLYHNVNVQENSVDVYRTEFRNKPKPPAFLTLVNIH